MDLLHDLSAGFGVASSLQNLLFAFCGCALGIAAAVLPGLGTVALIAILLPATYGLGAAPALILLAGVCYGAHFGGSIAGTLVEPHGSVAASATSADGHAMARQGSAGSALAVAGLGAFLAGCVGTLVLALAVPPLTALAFKFGPAEYFSLFVFGLVGSVVLASGSLLKAIAMIVLGLLLAQVGTDPTSGVARYGLGLRQLGDGIGLVVIAIGLFGAGEVIVRLGQGDIPRQVLTTGWRPRWPTGRALRQATPAVLRGTALGAALGVLLGSFASTRVERALRARPDEVPVGSGNLRGVAGPASAQGAGAHTAFIPLLAFGIPPNALMALLIGALTIQGIRPGPQVMSSHPALFWGLVASMFIGNLMLVVLAVPLICLWSRLLKLPYRHLFPAVVVLCCIGVYTLHRSSVDVYLMAGFAVFGYLLHKLRCEPAPLLMGFILGPMMEDNLRSALTLSNGDWGVLINRPISASLLAAAALLIAVVMLPAVRRGRAVTFLED